MLREIRRARELNLPLTPMQENLLFEVQRWAKMRPTEEVTVDHDGTVRVSKTVQVDAIFDAVKLFAEIQAERPNKNRRYLGSIDQLTAAKWAKESKTKIGTREFALYAKRKLASGDFSKFSAGS